MSTQTVTLQTPSVTASPRPLWQIAKDIQANWSKPYFGAVPYIHALRTMDKIDDDYGLDSGKSIVLYFLANAQTWRGPAAKAIKAELKAIAGVK